MDAQEIDPYEQQLLAEFESCDREEQGCLDIDGLEELCDKLQLDDLGFELINYLINDATAKTRVSFSEFREGLLALLADKQKICNSDRGSPEREVSPKFVFGTKKYGRRSRPESTEQDGEHNIELDGSDTEIFITIDPDDNKVLMISNSDDQKNSKKRKSESVNSSPINHAVKQQHRGSESDVFNETRDTPVINNAESIEEGLKDACERLGVGQDGFLGRDELSLLCNAIGMEKMAEEIVKQLFDKLKVDHNGRISFQEFLLLLRNGDSGFQSPVNGDVSSLKISENFQQHSISNEERSVRDKDSQFSIFDPLNMGFVSGEVIVEMWESAGISHASSLLQDLGFSETHQVNMAELIVLLEEELRPVHEAKQNEGLKTCNPYESLLQALLVLCQMEIRSLKYTVEHMSAERDKLRADILDANQRASLLAQEVDDHHARLEKSSQMQVKLLEQKFAEQLKDMTQQLSQEREQMVAQTSVLEKRLAVLQEEEAKLRNDLAASKTENGALENENHSLLEQLAAAQEAQTELRRQVESLEGFQIWMNELEGNRQHEQLLPLLEKVNKLETENMELRDHCDELTAKYENLTALFSNKLKLSNNQVEPGEDCDPVGGSVATKRRVDSIVVPPVGDNLRGESPRLGKMRRCCKKRSLPDFSLDSANMEDVQIPSTSGVDIGVDAVLEVEETGQYEWPCNNVSSLAEDEKNVEIERLRSRISALEEELVQQAKNSAAMDSSEIHFFEKPPTSLTSLRSDPSKSLKDVKLQLKEVFQLIRQQVTQELQENLDHGSSQQNSENTHAKDPEQLNEYCRTLETCLNEIKLELSGIARSKLCSKEGCTLKSSLYDLEKKLDSIIQNLKVFSSSRSECFNKFCVVPTDNSCSAMLSDISSSELNKSVNEDSEMKPAKEMNTEFSLTSECNVDSGYSHSGSTEISLFTARPAFCEMITDCEGENVNMSEVQALLKDMEDLKAKLIAEEKKNSELISRSTELETALDLLRQEYEKTEDYWSTKLDDERKLFEEEQRTSDEKFAELLGKIREYEELFDAQEDNRSENSDGRLSTIEERASLEKQVTDLEEECEELRLEQTRREEQLLHLQEELQSIERQRSLACIKQDIAVQVSELQNGSWESSNSIVLDLGGLRNLTNTEDSSSRSPKLNECMNVVSNGAYSDSISNEEEDVKYLQNLRKELNRECKVLTEQRDSLSQEIMDMERRAPPVRKNGVAMHYSYPPASKSASQACRVDLSVLQTLNVRLRQQEQRYRQLQVAMKQQQQQTETILKRTWQQHKEEVSELHNALQATQEQLHMQNASCKEQMEKLMRSDVLVKDLYVENAYLVATIQRLEQRLQVLMQMTSEACSV